MTRRTGSLKRSHINAPEKVLIDADGVMTRVVALEDGDGNPIATVPGPDGRLSESVSDIVAHTDRVELLQDIATKLGILIKHAEQINLEVYTKEDLL